jgi:DNA recombination protein RmuC
MVERSNQEAQEISDKAGDIYNQVCTVAERLLKVGTSLKAASNNYNHTVTSLMGQQGLHGKVERFNQLSSKVSKKFPALEATHMDFDTERLALIAEPVVEV